MHTRTNSCAAREAVFAFSITINTIRRSIFTYKIRVWRANRWRCRLLRLAGHDFAVQLHCTALILFRDLHGGQSGAGRAVGWGFLDACGGGDAGKLHLYILFMCARTRVRFNLARLFRGYPRISGEINFSCLAKCGRAHTNTHTHTACCGVWTLSSSSACIDCHGTRARAHAAAGKFARALCTVSYLFRFF